jgi:cyclic lactone autoinducer peptide
MREQKVMKLVKKLGEKVVAGSVNSASSIYTHEVKRPANVEKILKK